MNKDTPTKTDEPLGIGETRVSDTRQLDGSHEFQESEIRRFAANLKIEIAADGFWSNTVKGDSDERMTMATALAYIDERIKNNKRRVTDYFCYNIERFTRGGHAMYDFMKGELKKRGVRMRDVAGIIQPDKNTMENLGMDYKWSNYSPSGTQELLEADRAKDNRRDMLTRMIGQEVINARQGYAVHPAPDGMINKRDRYHSEGKRKRRSTRYRDPERAPFYEKMFKLRAEGQMSDEKIVEEINKDGYLSKVRTRWSKDSKTEIGYTGGIPLTVKQLQAIIQRPIYAGVNYEVFTLWKPVRAVYAGLVEIDRWNKANRGRWFIEELPDGLLQMHQNYNPEIRTRDNEQYPFKDVILCTFCKELEGKERPFRGSASRSKNGNHYPAYHADHKINGVRHKRIGVNKHVFEKQVEEFVTDLQFQPELLKSFQLVLMDTFNQKQAGTIEAATGAEKRVIDLQEQKQAATKAYIAANAVGDEDLMSDIKAERTRLDQLLKVAQGHRDELEVDERDLDEFVWRVNWVMEHPHEFLLRAGSKQQRRAYFSLMFDELPTYQDVLDGTPKLSWIFRLDSEKLPEKGSEKSLVRRGGFEPP
ncbi:MAG: recombinase family protein [Patescibacteria group bacterium]